MSRDPIDFVAFLIWLAGIIGALYVLGLRHP
jgi:hypothetical protein